MNIKYYNFLFLKYLGTHITCMHNLLKKGTYKMYKSIN